MRDTLTTPSAAISGFGDKLDFELRDAAKAGAAAGVARLLTQGASPLVEFDGRSALVWAVAAKSAECVRLLIPVSNVGAQRNLALHTATQTQNLEIGRLLLPHCEVFAQTKAWPNAMEAAYNEMAGDEWIAEIVGRVATTPESERPENLDEIMSKMFFLSAGNGAWRSIAAILPYVDAQAVNENLNSALLEVLNVSLASASAISSCLDILLPGANLLGADELGRNALMSAASNGHADSVEQVLDYAKSQGQEPGALAVDMEGKTALMLAAENGSPQSVSALLPWSDPTRKTPRGETAFDLAVKAGRWRCADELAQHASVEFLDRATLLCPQPSEMPRARALQDARAIKGELAAVAAVHAQEDAQTPDLAEKTTERPPATGRRTPRSL